MKLEPITRAVLQLLGIALAAYALYSISAIISFAIISLYISILGRPFYSFLQHKTPVGKRLGTTTSAGITMLLLMAIAGTIIRILAPMVVDEFAFLGAIPYDDLIKSLESEWHQLDVLLSSLGVDSSKELNQINNSLQKFASVDAISSMASNILGGLGNLTIAIFSICFMTFFLLREQHLSHQFVDWVTPVKHHGKVNAMLPQIKRVVTRYSFGILLQISAIFILLSIGLSLLGVQGAVVLALLAAIFNLLPYVGPIIGASLGILLGLGQLYTAGIADPSLEINLLNSLYLLVGLFGGVQLLDNILFQPLIFSNSVGAHPLEIFLVISIAGTLLGVGGMIIAVPSYSILRIVLNTVRNRWEESAQ
jgi:predicted PurR-regulated permease PerM